MENTKGSFVVKIIKRYGLAGPMMRTYGISARILRVLSTDPGKN
jgi:hypothetical protein